MIPNNSQTGKYIGGYHISLELASSSSSRVFLGESVSPDRHNVAIKRIYIVSITSKEDEEKFLKEATILKQLSHPYILPIRSAYVLKGTPYIVSDYAPNGNLRDRLQRYASKPMLEHEATTLLSQIGQALHYAHQNERLHGNLKPQNILFNGKGDALLADFKFTSLSPLIDVPTRASLTEFAYASIEQIEGIISKESDQYALGCIAYEMFTGRKPFTTPSVKQPGTYYKVRTLIPPTKLNPALPTHIEQAILKAMAKDPAQRHKNILEFIKALNTPAPLVVPKDSMVGMEKLASQKNINNFPLFPGLKVATAGATTLAQFSAKAALLRNTFTSMAGFSTFPRASGKYGLTQTPAPRTRRNVLRPLLVIASLLLITAMVVGMAFAFSPLHTPQGKQASTGKVTTPATSHSQTVTPGKTKSGNPQATPTQIAIRITVPVQPTQPVRPVQHPQPTTQPTRQPPPTRTAPPTATTPPSSALVIAPTILNGGNCARNTTTFVCTVTLSLGAAATTSQNWYTYSIGVSANFTPSSGTIAPGHAVNIQITVFDTCTKTGTFVFVGSKTNVTAAWSC